MQWEVKLIKRGRQFSDYVYAEDFNDAREITQIHRNPGSTFLSANVV